MRMILLLLSGWFNFSPVFGNAPEDLDYVANTLDLVEHEVEDRDALYAARELFRSMPPAQSGCSQCSSQDMDYCVGKDLLYDHCCCDRNIPERYPYIPHVCYKHQVPLCQPVATDCEEFLRLDICCCQPYLRPQWQYYSWKTSRAMRRSSAAPLALILIVIAAGRQLHRLIM